MIQNPLLIPIIHMQYLVLGIACMPALREAINPVMIRIVMYPWKIVLLARLMVLPGLRSGSIIRNMLRLKYEVFGVYLN